MQAMPGYESHCANAMRLACIFRTFCLAVLVNIGHVKGA